MKKIIYILTFIILPNLLLAQTERKIGDFGESHTRNKH